MSGLPRPDGSLRCFLKQTPERGPRGTGHSGPWDASERTVWRFGEWGLTAGKRLAFWVAANKESSTLSGTNSALLLLGKIVQGR